MSGLLCSCSCASCGRDLQACSLTGKVRRYFRHHNNSSNLPNCNPNTANESALHKMAKQIIYEEKSFFVPCRSISLDEAGITDLPLRIKDSIPHFELQKAKMIFSESIELEKHLPNFTPDIVMKTKRGELLIEIFVSHRVDEYKMEKVKNYGAALLELDLRKYVGIPITSSELRTIIIEGEQDKNWLYYPLNDENIDRAKRYYEDNNEVKKYRQKVADELRRERIEKENKERRDEKLKRLFEPQKYLAEIKRLRNDQSFMEFYSKYCQTHWFAFDKYYAKNGEVPFFIDIPITGEMIFQCDRRIWQSIIFNRFIYGRKAHESKINIRSLFEKLKDDHHINIDHDLAFKLTNPFDEEETIFLMMQVVSKYMEYLELIGFIHSDNSYYRKRNDWKTVVAVKTIDPPNKKAAEVLLNSLRDVDVYSPKIDHLLADKLSTYKAEMRQKALEDQKRAEDERNIQLLEMYYQQELERQQIAEKEALQHKQEYEEKMFYREKVNKAEYDQGLSDVLGYDFDQPINRYDRYGKQWLRCTICGTVKRDDDILIKKFGKGECRECLRSSGDR